MSKPLISVIVPVYNEVGNVDPFFAALQPAMKRAGGYHFEVIFVDDGSSDQTVRKLKKLAKQKNIHLIEFVRNFGKEAATSAGLSAAQGAAAIMIDGDMQHPASLIPKFIKSWQSGAEVVVGVRNDSKSDSAFKRWSSAMFYRILNRISDTKLVPYSTDYTLIDRVVIDEFNRLTERGRITRGLISWLGFKTTYIKFEAKERLNGKANYSTLKLARLAINSFISLSLFPLKIAGYSGIVISALALPAGIFMYVDRFLIDNASGLSFSGTALLAVLLLFLVGVVLSSLGLIALYIGAIHGEVINRPLYVIRKRSNK